MKVHVSDILFEEHQIRGLVKLTVTQVAQDGRVYVNGDREITEQLGNNTFTDLDSTVYHEWSQRLDDEYQIQQLQAKIWRRVEQMEVYGLSFTEFNRIVAGIEEK